MKLVRKTVAAILLLIGLPIAILCTVELLDSERPAAQREGSLAALMLFGLPATTLGSWLAMGLYRQAQQERKERDRTAKAQLRTQFFTLLQVSQSRLTVLQLAMEAQISGGEARQFLDEMATEFNATFDTSEQGDIIYCFNFLPAKSERLESQHSSEEKRS